MTVAGALVVAPLHAHADLLLDELARLVHEHPEIRSRHKQLESAGHGVDKAKSRYLPEVRASGDSGAEFIDSPSERNKNRPGNKGFHRGRTSGTLTITQNLFEGFASLAAVKTASIRRQISQVGLETFRSTTMLDGVSQYIDVIRQKRLIDLALGNEENIQRQLNLEDERVQRGSGVTVDVLQAKSRLQLAKERRVTFEGALQDAVSRYKKTFNHAPDVDAMIDPVPPLHLLPQTLQEVIEVSHRESVVNAIAELTVSIAQERQRTINSEYFPTFDLVGEFNYEKHVGGVIGTRRDYSVLLQANWDLFTGFSTVTGARQVAADYQAALANQENTRRQSDELLQIAWQNLITTRERVALLENAVNIASEVYTSRLKLREAGKETVINVLDAENEISNAQINYTATTYDLKVAVYALLLAMGRLTPAQLGLPDSPPEYYPPVTTTLPEQTRQLPEPLIPDTVPPPERRAIPEPIVAPEGEGEAPPSGFWDNTPDQGDAPAALPGDAPGLPGDEPSLPGDAPGLPGDLPSLPGDAPTLPGDLPSLPGDAPTLPGDLPSLPGDTPSLPGDLPSLPGDTPTLPGDLPSLPGDTQPAPPALPAPKVTPEKVPSLTPAPKPQAEPKTASEAPKPKKRKIPFWELEDFGTPNFGR